MLNFEQDIRIDKYSLEEEVAEQSRLLYEYDEEMNTEKDILSRQQLELSIAEATVALSVRSGAYKGQDGKVTENVVKEIVDADTDLNKKREAIIDQQRILSRVSSAAEAIRQRRYMLQKEVDLYVYEYYNRVAPNGSRPNMAGGNNVEDEQLQGLSRKGILQDA